jgi:membrane-bound lytic murein transglycosylase D
MGGDLLRRKVLRIKSIAVLLIVSLAGSPAAENSPVQQEPGAILEAALETLQAEANPVIEAALFPRPLRSRADASPAQSSSREPGGYPESPLFTREAMSNPLTQHYIRQYSGPGGLAWLSSVMERGGPYLAFIRKEIAERKLPPELVYLPVIESGYVATAVSGSGAAGLWQFMKNSIAPFDIKVNDWVDERRDFWKSTQGALRKLEDNYNHFKDWPLALAAYNAGLTAVNRALQQSNVKDYWALSEKKLLKTETVHYVPKLLAAAYILSNQRRYGMTPLWPEDPEWRRLAVERSVDIRILADRAGIDSGALLRANRELLYNVTPPGQKSFLKVAAKDMEKAAAVLARNDIPLVNFYVHTVRSGDTLLALALHYGSTVDQILALNPGVEARFLRIGSRLAIPALKDASPPERPARIGENLAFNGTHLVKRGETLWSIAMAYGVDPEVLAEANGMELTGILREGRTLKTPIK